MVLTKARDWCDRIRLARVNQVATFLFNGLGWRGDQCGQLLHVACPAANLGSQKRTIGLEAPVDRIGVEKNIEKSLAWWYNKAPVKNDPRAFYDLALNYLQTKPNRTSLEMAKEYIGLAAQGGHREAQFQCAISFFAG